MSNCAFSVRILFVADADIAQQVERILGKDEVASSNLAISSIKITFRYSWVYVRQHCAEIDEAARNRMKLIVRSLAEQNGMTEQLKAENQMEWVRQMNACKAQAEEVVKAELIYD